MKARQKWPDEVRKYHWREKARDLYLKTMAHYCLYEESPAERGSEKLKAIACFEEAEKLFNTLYSPYDEYVDILDVVRRTASNTLKHVTMLTFITRSGGSLKGCGIAAR